MYPVLLRLGQLRIYSTTVMYVLALAAGVALALVLATRKGLPRGVMLGACGVAGIGAIVGAYALNRLLHLGEPGGDGLVAYGALLGTAGAAGLYFRLVKVPALAGLDALTPGLAAGVLLGRIGCYLFGCDFGRPLGPAAPDWLKALGTFPQWPEGTLPYGVGSPAWVAHLKEGRIDLRAESSLPVHPTQLYEVALGAVLLGLLLLLAYRRRQPDGKLLVSFFFGYSVGRYLLEATIHGWDRVQLGPVLPQHVLLPLGLSVLSAGYVFGFSRSITSPTLRRMAQGMAFAPVLGLCLLLRPASFAEATQESFSEHQVLALLTGVAASLVASTLRQSERAAGNARGV